MPQAAALSRQIAALEDKLANEREARQLAQADLDKARARAEAAAREAESLRASRDAAMVPAAGADGPDAPPSREAQRLRKEHAALAGELKAVEHHRGVLRDTIEQVKWGSAKARTAIDCLSHADPFPPPSCLVCSWSVSCA